MKSIYIPSKTRKPLFRQSAKHILKVYTQTAVLLTFNTHAWLILWPLYSQKIPKGTCSGQSVRSVSLFLPPTITTNLSCYDLCPFSCLPNCGGWQEKSQKGNRINKIVVFRKLCFAKTAKFLRDVIKYLDDTPVFVLFFKNNIRIKCNGSQYFWLTRNFSVSIARNTIRTTYRSLIQIISSQLSLKFITEI